jgi:uncharacterized membrane protein YtjA (UPF0391 family)
MFARAVYRLVHTKVSHLFPWHERCGAQALDVLQKDSLTFPEETKMLYYAVVFFVIALIAALFGFGGIAAGAAGIAKILFVVFLIVSLVTFLLSLSKR